ncbi:YbbR-like protein [Saccharicrinis carchari]|uniref:YbbR-like protein n=1 Tax=Saccharicrinis carchari TaxID=1168039 RepID=A0A521BB56_SACCC|nr:YbbR-like domain-containing protein [Saccharicrinis carchari]SMO44221.1 YbbR-like protein [Saccharicrinis carchari]
MKQFKNNITKWSDKAKTKFASVKQNRDLLVFMLFLVLATGLWFLNALRKEFTTSISYPVKYGDFPDDFILLGKPQNKLNIEIKSLGYNILPYHMGKLLEPHLLKVSTFRRIETENRYGAYLPTHEIFKNFAGAFPKDVELLSISPDTLFIYFEKKVRKRVPVKFNSQLNFKQQYYQSGQVSIKPDSIEVAGPGSLLDSTLFVNTEFMVYEGLSDSLIRNVSLEQIANVTFNPARVVVSIPIEPYTQKNMRIPIQHLNVPDTLALKTFPDDIGISFTVAASRFNKVKIQDFSVAVDFNSSTTPGLPDRLKVRMLKQPEGIKNVSYSPLFVECLFKKVKER